MTVKTMVAAVTLLAASQLCAQQAPETRATTGLIENRGQWVDEVRFAGHAGSLAAWACDDGWTLGLVRANEPGPIPIELLGRAAPTAFSGRSAWAVRSRFVGATPCPPTGLEPLPGQRHFFLGNDPGRWAIGVRAFARIRYASIWPGIDLVVEAGAAGLRLELLLAPSADLAAVRIAVDGANALEIDAGGCLAVRTPVGAVRQPLPRVSRLLTDGTTQPIHARFQQLDPRTWGLEAAAVGPLASQSPAGGNPAAGPALEWATYLGGSAYDLLNTITRTAGGQVIAVSDTLSLDFPRTIGAYSALTDAAVTRLDPEKSGAAQLDWSVVFGGAGDDYAWGVALGPGGVATVSGMTFSSTFPIVNGYDATHNGSRDGYLANFDSSGVLRWSTFVGGSGLDYFQMSPHVDAQGVITAAGSTNSTDFPTTANAFQRARRAGPDAIAVRLDPRQPPASQLVWATYFGGAGGDYGRPAIVDSAGIITIGGYTVSTDLPMTSGAFPFKSGASPWPMDGFVARFDPSQSGAAQLVWSTYFGGSGPGSTMGGPSGDAVQVFRLTTAGLLLLSGWTDSLDLPTTASAYDRTYNGSSAAAGAGGDGYVACFDPRLPAAQGLVASTYLGGPLAEVVWEGMGIDAGDVITVAGWTAGAGFPTTPGAYKATFEGTVQGWITRLALPLSTLTYSTLLGGRDGETILYGIALDDTNASTVALFTSSSTLPTTANAYQPAFMGGTHDGAVARLSMLPQGASKYGTSTPGCRPIAIGVDRMPKAGDGQFAVTCIGAPPASAGILGLDAGQSAGLPILGVRIYLQLSPSLLLIPVPSDAIGRAAVPLPLTAVGGGLQVYGQFVWLNTAACGGLGTLSASNALDLVVQS